jgi:hypothetical protein
MNSIDVFDIHMARVAPLTDQLGKMPWQFPICWFYDFGIVEYVDYCVRIGYSPSADARQPVRDLRVDVIKRGHGTIASQTFPFVPYTTRTATADDVVMIVTQGNVQTFVIGRDQRALKDTDYHLFATFCRAIEHWVEFITPKNNIQPTQFQCGKEPVESEGINCQGSSGLRPTTRGVMEGHAPSGPRPTTDPDHVVLLD